MPNLGYLKALLHREKLYFLKKKCIIKSWTWQKKVLIIFSSNFMNGIYSSWKKIYISMLHQEKKLRVVLKSKSHIEEYEYENKNSLNQKSNIYLAKISRVEPSLQAAFVNYGRERHGFLAFNDIQSDYYQIPIEDKEELQKAEEKIRRPQRRK